MEIDGKIVIASIIAIILAIGVYIYNSMSSPKHSQEEDISSIIEEAKDALESDIEEDLYAHLLRSDTARKPETLYVMPTIPQREETAIDVPAVEIHEKKEEGISQEKRDVLKNKDKSDVEERLLKEAQKLEEFYRDVSDWANPNRSAADGRRKAHSIRQSADSLEREANDEEKEIKKAMLERVAIMRDYADRISSSRGNTTKLRILMKNVDDDIKTIQDGLKNH